MNATDNDTDNGREDVINENGTLRSETNKLVDDDFADIVYDSITVTLVVS